MNKYASIMVLICLIGCSPAGESSSGSITGASTTGKVELVDGITISNTTGMTGCTEYAGTIKNTGDVKITSCKIIFTAYSDIDKKNIIYSDYEYPVSSYSDLPLEPGVSKSFSWVTCKISDKSLIKASDYNLSWRTN